MSSSITYGIVRLFYKVIAGFADLGAELAERPADAARARAGELRARSRGDVLTPRERQVLELLVEGMSNKQIALRLHPEPGVISRP